MNGWLRLTLGTAVLCLGTACGTLRTGHPATQSTGPLTPAPPMSLRWVGRAVLSPPPSARMPLNLGGAVRTPRPTMAGSGANIAAVGGPWVLSPVGGEGGEARGVRAGDLQSPPLPAMEQPNGDSKSPTRVFQKWNPIWWFGNVDDPEPPDWYQPNSSSRRWLWQLRNPLHNFTFYVIGIADKCFTRTGRFPQAVFAPDGGWNWAVARYGWLRLPFVSFNGERCRFYLGWRERGNFGGKMNFGRLETSDRRQQTSDLDSARTK